MKQLIINSHAGEYLEITPNGDVHYYDGINHVYIGQNRGGRYHFENVETQIIFLRALGKLSAQRKMQLHGDIEIEFATPMDDLRKLFGRIRNGDIIASWLFIVGCKIAVAVMIIIYLIDRYGK